MSCEIHMGVVNCHIYHFFVRQFRHAKGVAKYKYFKIVIVSPIVAAVVLGTIIIITVIIIVITTVIVTGVIIIITIIV